MKKETKIKGIVLLQSRGNPDFKQDPNKSRSLEKKIEANSLQEASSKCLDYIKFWNLGGGNWTGGQVYVDGKQVARISYNGRIWETTEKFGHGKEIQA